LKPLSVTLPFVARFTVLGDSEAAREVHSKFSESKNRDSVEEGEVATLARFLISLPMSARCRTSEQQTVG
jgi:hypothetical protein